MRRQKKVEKIVGKLPPDPKSSSTTATGPPREKSSCCHKVTEFACSVCMLCVCCPISLICCCLTKPCMIGCRLLQNSKCVGGGANSFNPCNCCFRGSSQRRVSSASASAAAYSSFSDTDSDDPRSSNVGKGSYNSKSLNYPSK
ncbi:hypothetical protein M9H77_29016 [Catharanthus roseus]|uniref:Uncharacterized protein n=1 Tax=Catharanthus roseus TaxID=4058 RepID=A0ACC0AH15_CATRO|nr:hypothetical protein M9H77_29016 [Catharanthus roseus]